MTEDETVQEVTAKTQNRLTPAQWAEIEELYELGQATMVDLAKRFDVSVQAISVHFKKKGIVRGSKVGKVASKVAEKVAEAVAASAATFADTRRQRIEETKNQSYEWQTALAKLTMKTIVEAQRKGVALGDVQQELKALRFASAIIAEARKERFQILDIENDVDVEQLPIIQIQDLSDRDIEIMTKDDENDDLIISLDEDDDIVSEGTS